MCNFDRLFRSLQYTILKLETSTNKCRQFLENKVENQYKVFRFRSIKLQKKGKFGEWKFKICNSNRILSSLQYTIFRNQSCKLLQSFEIWNNKTSK